MHWKSVEKLIKFSCKHFFNLKYILEFSISSLTTASLSLNEAKITNRNGAYFVNEKTLAAGFHSLKDCNPEVSSSVYFYERKAMFCIFQSTTIFLFSDIFLFFISSCFQKAWFQ